MAALLEFLFLAIHYLIQAVIWIVIGNAIVSWLIAFDVINMRNADQALLPAALRALLGLTGSQTD